MGMLDDAIREHLELKRRAGAAEDEVARLEAEVLQSEAEPEPEPEPVPAKPGEPPDPAEPVADDAIAPTGPEIEEALPEIPPSDAVAEHEIVPAFTDEEPWLDEPDEVPSGDALDRPRARQPTTEFTPAEVAEAEGEPEYVAPDEELGEDVLEETPEFLQETPEHDRLWFEQKPPRDFDFDA